MCEARNRNHRAPAHVTDPDTDPDRRAWHQSHAAPEPNEDAHALLDSVLSGPLDAPVQDRVVAEWVKGGQPPLRPEAQRRIGRAGQRCALADANAGTGAIP
jgi:hypothetical protein